jgi:hypothetical protein
MSQYQSRASEKGGILPLRGDCWTLELPDFQTGFVVSALRRLQPSGERKKRPLANRLLNESTHAEQAEKSAHWLDNLLLKAGHQSERLNV